MRLYTKQELHASRIFFDKKPPIFLTIFIIATGLFFILMYFISAFLPKTYIVEAQGIITTQDNTYIGALSDGVLVDIHKEEGSTVKAGDVLFTISNGSEGVQHSGLQAQLEQMVEKEKAMYLYLLSLEKQQNNMQNSGFQQEYYGKMMYYLSLVNDERKNSDNSKSELSKKTDKLKEKRVELQDLQKQFNALPSQSPADSSNDDVIIDNNEGKKSELQSKIDSKKSEIEALEDEIEQMRNQGGTPSQSEQMKSQLIGELGSARSNLMTQKQELESQINAYRNQDSLTEVKAENNGYIHYLNPLKSGMMIQKAQTVGEISENEEDQMLVEAYIQASDISKVSVDDSVNVAIQGVNIQKYGTLKGRLKRIDSGTLTQETKDGNMIFYRCLVAIDEKILNDKYGEEIKAIKSMPVTARIVYDKETYLDWLLEMLSFKN